MLKEIWECDESRYPASISNPSKGSGDGSVKNTNYYDKKNYDQHGYGNCMTQAANIRDEPDDYESNYLSEDKSERENDDVQQDKSYHVGVITTADEGEAFFGKCYNCGHPWHDCKKPLKPALWLALNSENGQKARRMEKKSLNHTGGTGVKGGHIPKAPLAPT